MTKNFYDYLEDNIVLIYRKARKYVIDKSGIDTFPLEYPYHLNQLLDED